VRSPDQPILVHMMRAPRSPGLDERAQHRIGRAERLAMSFEDFERNIRDQLAGTLGRAASIRPPTSPRSPSTAGPADMPTNTTRCSIRTGASMSSPTSSAA
jgi:hypothetical protein